MNNQSFLNITPSYAAAVVEQFFSQTGKAMRKKLRSARRPSEQRELNYSSDVLFIFALKLRKFGNAPVHKISFSMPNA
jgi:hypothetical protein